MGLFFVLDGTTPPGGKTQFPGKRPIAAGGCPIRVLRAIVPARARITYPATLVVFLTVAGYSQAIRYGPARRHDGGKISVRAVRRNHRRRRLSFYTYWIAMKNIMFAIR